MKKITLIIISLILGLLLTFVSGLYVRDYKAVTGNVCEVTEENPQGLCYDDLPMIGLPFAYLKDSPGVSVQGSLHFVEDDFNVGYFILDWLIFSSIIGLILFLIRRKPTKPNN